MRKFILLCVSCLIHMFAANAEEPRFISIPPSTTGLDFINKVPLPSFFNNKDFMFVITGGGTAAGDLNNDGLIDLVFTGAYTRKKVFLNQGNFHFKEITSDLQGIDTNGMSFGVTIVDVNADGWNDIYISKYGYVPNKLYINNHDGTFTEKAKEYGLDWAGNSIQATFFDYDKDGDLDMYLVLNGRLKEGYRHGGDQDRFFRNNGDNTFSEVSAEIGIKDKGYGLSATAADINNDGWTDIFVAQDFEQRDILYINQKNGTFKDMASDAFPHCSYFSMGNDVADFNNDGLLDIFVVDMLPRASERRNTQFGIIPVFSPTFDSSQVVKNVLHLNRGNGTFSDIAYLSGIADTEWSWTTWFADLDNDGYKDLYVTNGLAHEIMDRDVNRFGDNNEVDFKTKKGLDEMVKKYPQVKVSNFLFRNKGNLQFEDVTASWGMAEPVNTNSAVYVDLDNDGDLDIVQNNLDTIPSVFKNTTIEQKSGNYIKIILHGNDKNPSALNSRVHVTNGTHKQVQEMTATRGFTSGMNTPLLFGIGKAEVIEEITVIWNDGKTQVLKNVQANRTLELFSKDAQEPTEVVVQNITKDIKKTKETKGGKAKKAVVQSVIVSPLKFNEKKLPSTYQRTERVFDDFFACRLQPNKLSLNGPSIAVGDVDGDGLDDFFIGGAEGTPAIIATQTKTGDFMITQQPALLADSMFEDQAALLFDLEKDGDLDLYVASGGNESVVDEQKYREDRVYLNDGHGNFSRSTQSLVMDIRDKGSSSCVVGADIDSDGDLDLFVGGRNEPGAYPKAPRSYILFNDNGVLRDYTISIAPAVNRLGMVTSALWTDTDNDGDYDLIVVGEWMYPRIFINNGFLLTELSSELRLDKYSGWWNSVNGGDFDNDGDIDYVLGNLGWNSRYKPTLENPIKMYVNDFDRNGSQDHIMTTNEKGKEVVIRLRDALVQQMPTLQKRFPNYMDFAKAGVRNLFTPADIDTAFVLKATNFSSVILENQGKGKFQVHTLPPLAQSSPIFGTYIEDVNGDGNLDIVSSGNFFGADTEMWRYDANPGNIIYGDGKMNFTCMAAQNEGLMTKGDTRGVAVLRSAKENSLALIVGVNNKVPQVFEFESVFSVLPVRSESGLVVQGANAQLKDGRVRKIEKYYGSGYYSQYPQLIFNSPNFKRIDFYGYKEK